MLQAAAIFGTELGTIGLIGVGVTLLVIISFILFMGDDNRNATILDELRILWGANNRMLGLPRPPCDHVFVPYHKVVTYPDIGHVTTTVGTACRICGFRRANTYSGMPAPKK